MGFSDKAKDTAREIKEKAVDRDRDERDDDDDTLDGSDSEFATTDEDDSERNLDEYGKVRDQNEDTQTVLQHRYGSSEPKQGKKVTREQVETDAQRASRRAQEIADEDADYDK